MSFCQHHQKNKKRVQSETNQIIEGLYFKILLPYIEKTHIEKKMQQIKQNQYISLFSYDRINTRKIDSLQQIAKFQNFVYSYIKKMQQKAFRLNCLQWCISITKSQINDLFYDSIQKNLRFKYFNQNYTYIDYILQNYGYQNKYTVKQILTRKIKEELKVQQLQNNKRRNFSQQKYTKNQQIKKIANKDTNDMYECQKDQKGQKDFLNLWRLKNCQQKHLALANIFYIQKTLIILDQLIHRQNERIEDHKKYFEQKIVKTQQQIRIEKVKLFRQYQDELNKNKQKWIHIKDQINYILQQAIEFYEKNFGKYESYYFIQARVELHNQNELRNNVEDIKILYNVDLIYYRLYKRRQLFIQKKKTKENRNIKKLANVIQLLEAKSIKIVNHFILFLQKFQQNQIQGELKKSLSAQCFSILSQIKQNAIKLKQQVKQKTEQAEQKYWKAIQQQVKFKGINYDF